MWLTGEAKTERFSIPGVGFGEGHGEPPGFPSEPCSALCLAAYTTTPPTLLITNTTESMTTDQSEPMTTASLTSSSPVTQSVNNSQPLPLTSPLIR